MSPAALAIEPGGPLARLGVFVLAKRCRWDDAAKFLSKPSAQARAREVADVGDRLSTELWRSRHAPTRQDELALAILAAAHDRRHLVGKNAGQERQIANAVVARAKPIPDRRLAFCEAIEVAHGCGDSGRV